MVPLDPSHAKTKYEEIGHFHNQPVCCFRLRDELVESQAEFLGSDIAKIMPEDESVAGTRPWLQRSGKSDAGGWGRGLKNGFLVADEILDAESGLSFLTK